MFLPLKLESQVSHFPVQSARHKVHNPDSAGFPRLAVPSASFVFCQFNIFISSFCYSFCLMHFFSNKYSLFLNIYQCNSNINILNFIYLSRVKSELICFCKIHFFELKFNNLFYRRDTEKAQRDMSH